MNKRQFAILTIVLVVGFVSQIFTTWMLRPLTPEEQAQRDAEIAHQKEEMHFQLLRKQFFDWYEGRIDWHGVSTDLLRTLEAYPDKLGENAIAVRRTIIALRWMGERLDALALKDGKYPDAKKPLIEIFDDAESWWMKDGWGNYFQWSEFPAESRNGLFDDNYLKFSIRSTGSDGMPFTDFEPALLGFYCYESKKVIWCVLPEEPDCEFGLPQTQDEFFQRRELNRRE